MNLLDTPTPLTDAVKHLLSKDLMPTSLGSADLRQLGSGLLRQSLFSARTLDTYHLDNILDVVESVLNPKVEQREDRVTESNPQGNVTTGLNPATARAALRKGLQDGGYVPAPEDKGTIKDLSGDSRLNLVIDTNVKLMQGAGQFVSGNADQDTVDLFPAWELIRFEDREVPRGEKFDHGVLVADPANGWPARFKAAAIDSGDDDALRVLETTGRMLSRKDSPLWDSLGAGAGGYEDTLGNPYPPFAFNSGYNWLEVPRKECVDVGLIDDDDKVAPADFDFASLFGALEEAA